MGRRRGAPVRLTWESGTPASQPPAELIPWSVVGTRRGRHGAGHLILGDNLPALAALERQFQGRVDLVYLDPPFFTGKAFSARVGTGEDSRRPSEWKTRAGYDDRWPDLPAYLDMLRPRLEALYRLLAPTGTLYIHLDWRAAGYLRVLLDEIFGPDRLLNEIAWVYHGPSPIRNAFSRKHDTLLVYTKSSKYTFNADAVRVPYNEATWKTFQASPRAGFGKRPDLQRGKVPEDWWYFPVVARLHRERTGYPTQKPLALLERVVLASSRPGDLVLDAFSGSGTTCVAAARLNRRWIGCDSSELAIATSYRRLLLECPGHPFQVSSTRPIRPAGALGQVRLEADGRQVEACLRSRRRYVWFEADWDFDGRMFHSRDQAALPWRSESPLPCLTHTFGGDRAHRVAFRAADASGRVYQQEATLALPA